MSKRKKTLDELLEEALVPEEEQLYEIPENWLWVELKSIAESIQYGYTESTSLEKIGPKFLRITDIQDNHVEWDNVPYCAINQSDYEKYKLEKNDILIARTGATTGKSYRIEEEVNAVFASYLIRVRLNELADASYVDYFMKSSVYWNQIMVSKKGIAQPGANSKILGALQIPLPNILEQKRIVEKIKFLFSKIDEAKQLIEEVKDTIELRRAAILDKVFRGELTTRVDDEINNKNKIENNKHNFQEPYQLPPNWKWVKISDLFEQVKQTMIPIGVEKYIGLEHLNKGGGILGIGRTEGLKSSKVVFKKGDVLYGKLRPYLNKHAYVNFDGVASTDIIVFRSKSNNTILSRLLDFYLGLPRVVAYANENSNGINLPRVSPKKMGELLFPLPPQNEQKIIVEKINRLLDKLNSEQELITNVTENLSLIKEAILAKAFKGELGTNDPTEELAIELLKSILQEKL